VTCSECQWDMGFKMECTCNKIDLKWLSKKYVTRYGKQMDDMMVLVIVKKTCDSRWRLDGGQ
jgi:hypothetical protein